MKILNSLVALALCAGLVFGTSSCVVRVNKDNGKHKGWYKNPNNPHHPNSTNPGNANPGNGNPKSKGKPKK